MQRLGAQQVLLSSCRLCKSVANSANCKNLFGKANRTLLVAAGEIYGRFPSEE